jgi:tRNA pseudouridine55 synthase
MPEGFCVVDKEAGWTSHDVVARARRLLGERRVGHSGTLDPDATGLLILGVGRATRLLRFLTDLPKSYTCEVVLGTETSTLDAAGEVTATHDMSGVTLEQVRSAAAGFLGDIEQVPPMVSAVKVGGRRLHELARAGVEVERAPRPVTIHRLEVGPAAGEGSFRLDVRCSSGTYVRTLAADIGTALGGGAHLRELRRTSIGSFTEADARPLDDLVVLPAAEGLRDYPSVTVGPEAAARVATGAKLDPGDLGPPGATAVPDGPFGVHDAASGALLAVYEPDGDRARPAVVLAARG